MFYKCFHTEFTGQSMPVERFMPSSAYLHTEFTGQSMPVERFSPQVPIFTLNLLASQCQWSDSGPKRTSSILKEFSSQSIKDQFNHQLNNKDLAEFCPGIFEILGKRPSNTLLEKGKIAVIPLSHNATF